MTERLSNPAPAVSSTVPDWGRERYKAFAWRPSQRLLKSLRQYQRWQGRWGPVGAVVRKWCVIRHRFWGVVCGADIPLNSNIAGGLVMPHPNGIVIHPGSVVGPNCMIFQQVTVGTVGSKEGLPRIGGHVDIGAGAKVLGPVTIGDHAQIGANAVVVTDVPAGAVAVGIPAKVLPAKEKRSVVVTTESVTAEQAA